MGAIWDKISKVENNQQTVEIYYSFVNERPHHTNIESQSFVGTVISAIIVGSLLGVAIANIFQSEMSKKIKALNGKIHTLKKNILITSKK